MKTRILGIIALVGVAMTSCQDNEPLPTIPSVKEIIVEDNNVLFDQEKNGVGLLIFTENEEPFVGYNELHVAVIDAETGNFSSAPALNFMPMMFMPMMNMEHTAPYTAPEKVMDGVYKIGIGFIMPSTAGDWRLEATVGLSETAEQVAFEIPITVVEKDDTRMLTFESDVDSAKLFVCLAEPLAPEVGENPFAVTIHKRESMMSFPAVTDYTVEIEPEMPTMDHGSPNNVNPTHVENGYYEGVVNFTMTGYWKVNLVIKDASGQVVKDNIAFDINF